jgi:hypothetical protein
MLRDGPLIVELAGFSARRGWNVIYLTAHFVLLRVDSPDDSCWEVPYEYCLN